MKRLLLILLGVSLLLPCVAQRPNDWRRQYEEFKRERNREYQDFKAQANAEFAEFLKQRWKDYKPTKGTQAPIPVVMPEPQRLPEVNPPARPLPKPEVDLDHIRRIAEGSAPKAPKAPKAPTTPATPVEPRRPDRPSTPAKPDRPATPTTPAKPTTPTTPARPAGELVAIDFFGDGLEVPWRKALAKSLSSTDESGFSAIWTAWSGGSDEAVRVMAEYADQHHLNGWGYYQLVKRFSEQVYAANRPDERIALQAFLLSQLKFRAKVAACGSRLVLLLPFEEQVYSVPYLVIGSSKYYIYSYGHDTSAGYRTYENSFSYADRNLSLAFDGKMEVGSTTAMEFPRMSALLNEPLSVPMSVGTVALLLNYPIIDNVVFYRQGVLPAFGSKVLSTLRRKVAGKSETEAVGFLLNFVQNGFEYITDNEAFGRQKQLFIEESFYYGRNNCKDRVGVFSWLVRELVGLDLIFVRFEGNAASNGVSHITCAVGFNGPVEGDAFNYKGRRYVMCDPTYINAGIGMTMPCYASSKGLIVTP